MNSPIQGFASEIGVKTARLIALNFYAYVERFGDPEDLTGLFLPTEVNKTVHDAAYLEVPYRYVIPIVYILQYSATYGVTAAYAKTYGIQFTIEPEIEMEISASEDKSYKWDWLDSSLKTVIEQSLDDQIKIKTLDEKDKPKALREIYSVFENKKAMAYLEKNYPILGVRKGDIIELPST
jgi:hypothetical protein